MSEVPSFQPSARKTVELWFGQLTNDHVHTEGWVEVNREEHDLAMGLRVYALKLFPDNPELRQALIDGFTIAFLGKGRLAFSEEFEALYTTESPPEEAMLTVQLPVDINSEAA